MSKPVYFKGLINAKDLTPEILAGLSLPYLYDQWRMAEVRLRTWSGYLQKWPADSALQRRVTNYQLLLQMLYSELVNRTGHLNTQFILMLIETGCSFSVRISNE